MIAAAFLLPRRGRVDGLSCCAASYCAHERHTLRHASSFPHIAGKGHFTPEQAEALAEALGEAGHDDLPTKTDLTALKAELKADIAEAKTDILKWMVGAIGFQTIVIVGALAVPLVRIFAK